MRVSLPRVFVALAFAGVSVASAQTLGDLAKKEEQRRKSAKPAAKVYTNKDLGPDAEAQPLPRPQTAPASTEAGPGGPEPGAAAAAKAPAEGEQDPAKTEEFWRDRITKAKADVERNELLLDALQSRVNALSTDFVNRDDPAQRAVIASDRQKALAEMDRVRQSIDASKKLIADIEEEARQAGVPPGWLR